MNTAKIVAWNLLSWLTARLPEREKLAQDWRAGNTMFGKSDWFRTAASGGCCGVSPANWKGWGYMVAWGAVGLLPATWLIRSGLGWESAIWLGATGSLWLWDMRQIRKGLIPAAAVPVEPEEPEDDVLVIDENETESARFAATRNYDLRLRK